MGGKWRRWSIGLGGWIVTPQALVGAVTTVVLAVMAALGGLPAAVVALIALGALTFGVVLTHYGIAVWRHLSRRKPPPELQAEVTAIQRELVRLANRRENSGGSIWPVQRPYQDLPSKEWNACAEKLRLRREDREVIAKAYELAGIFNDKMLAGETTIASSPEMEPDLDGLRTAFDRAAKVLGLSPAPLSASAGPASSHEASSPPPSLGEFGRRDDRGALAQRCHMLAGSVERWVDNGKTHEGPVTAKMAEEWLEEDAELEPAEAVRLAHARYEKTREADYRLKYEDEARKLFLEAWELGEIAKEHEQLAVAPLLIQFDEVPKLFNQIASRLYGEPVEDLSI